MRLGDRPLTADERQELHGVLKSVFRPDSFEMMLTHRLGWQRADITMANQFPKQIFDVIDYAEEHEATKDLLVAALAERLTSQNLHAFSQKFEETPSSSLLSLEHQYKDPLERRIRELDSTLNVVQWRTHLEHLERQVCRIVIQAHNKVICGTGILVASDVVLTCFHILKEVIDGDIARENVTFSFDYKLQEDGQTFFKETVCHLTDDWLIDYSQYSTHDLRTTEHCADVEASQLDYAILRLEENVGNEMIDKNTSRGWISLPEQKYPFTEETPVFILHHPYGDPLSLALNTHSLQEINSNKTRVRYLTFTEEGSSGAPCFSTHWELIAIHQSGDPDFQRAAQYNQGIPIQAIIRLLYKRGKMKFIQKKSDLLQTPPDADTIISLQHNAAPARLDPPEEQMPIAAQILLIDLYEKGFFSVSAQGSISINDKMIERAATFVSPEQTLLLFSGYRQVAYETTKKAWQILRFRGDIRRVQFMQACKDLQTAGMSLQKLCILLNHVSFLPKTLSQEMRLQVCLKATKIKESNEQLCLEIKTMQEISPNDREYRGALCERCGELLEKLRELGQ